MTSQVYGGRYGLSPAETYERFFVPNIGLPMARGLLDVADPRPGERVLDVACGTGVVTRLAADAVGASGTVVGLDVTPPMLDVARGIPAQAAIEWLRGDVQALPLEDDAFDLVLCQMGLQFVSDKIAALKEMRRVLAPGGRLALNVPGPTPDLFAELAQALATHVAPEAASFCHLVFSLNDKNELQELGRAGGFREVNVYQATQTLEVPGAEDFLWGYVYSTPMAAHLVDMDSERRVRFASEVGERWQRFTTPEGMKFQVVVSTLCCK